MGALKITYCYIVKLESVRLWLMNKKANNDLQNSSKQYSMKQQWP